MPTNCPKCGKGFRGRSIGTHADVCPVTSEDLFWAKVDRSPGESACWPWMGAITTHGYGCFNWNKRVLGAHKLAYVLTKGAVPHGMQIRHACDNPPCCNPAHLSIGTRQDNADDKAARGRGQKRNPRKLTAELAAEIRSLRGKLSSGEIAKRYGISQSYTFTIWGGRVWKT